MEKKRIVVLGGGYAGIAAAKKLSKKFKKNESVEINLIERNNYHVLMTELHEVAGSRVHPDAVMISYDKIFSGSKVNQVQDVITGIDFKNRIVKSERSGYSYDYLVIGSGGAPEFFDIPGIQENSFSLWSLEDALRIREHGEELFRLAAKEKNSKRKRKMLTFIIAGAGFTGIELMGEFIERRDILCKRYKIDKSEVHLKVVEAKDSILPMLDKGLRKKAVKYLEKNGVEVCLGVGITGAAEGKVLLADKTELLTDTFVWTCGVHGSEFTSKIDLTKGHNARGKCSIATEEGIHGLSGCKHEDDEQHIVGRRGRILVNEYMQSVDFKNVFVVGDNLWYLENEKALPQIVETAMQTGETSADNIIADINNKPKKPFKSNYHGSMVSIGSKYAVSNAGGMNTSGFIAKSTKHFINIHYISGIAGMNAVWKYIGHEFFCKKSKI